jgi:uncharacterized protein (TIGR00297 family)
MLHFLPSFAVAAVVTVAFAALARAVRGVSRGGAVAGAACCFILYAGAGLGAFLALISLFALAWATTRLGYSRKQKLGVAERKDGRNAWQVVANLGLATLCAAAFRGTGNPVFLVALAAAFSEAAADTVSSELGQASGTGPRLVTTWKPVEPGTNGGITWAGTLAGTTAAAIVSGVCVVSQLLSVRGGLLAAFAGIAGMICDSYLGATFERRGWLNNDAVNFLSTVVAAFIVFALA